MNSPILAVFVYSSKKFFTGSSQLGAKMVLKLHAAKRIVLNKIKESLRFNFLSLELPANSN